MTLEAQIKELKKQVKLGQTVILKHELKCMKRVLRRYILCSSELYCIHIISRLGYTTAEDIVETKGRVACEINAADELVITELIFGGVFNELSIEQGVAMLSCFVFQEKVNS
jgi:ATP-dependent RNA helicase DOB1